MSSHILLTGGAGYIGSHVALQLIQAGYKVLILDNFSNSDKGSIKRVTNLTGVTIPFVCGDVRDSNLLEKVFKEYSITSVMHFAGLKSVEESVRNPIEYYQNNVAGTIALIQAMSNAGVYNIVFSSSATVYGDLERVPASEESPTNPSNTYGHSKLMVEEILRDLSFSNPEWSIAILRYFNPAGAHESGMIGEDPNGDPGNLVPYITQVAAGKKSELVIFGNDYKTKDGTGVRDYIHVMDLSNGHVKALEALEDIQGVKIWNLGSGKGVSVLEVLREYERVVGAAIPYRFAIRRSGDVGECWADPSSINKELGWVATRDLRKIIIDAWNWQCLNPNGYKCRI